MREGAFGTAYTAILVFGPNREPEGPRNVRLTRDTQSSRRLAWDAPRDPWLTTVRTARDGSGPQQVVTDPWTTGYRVERHEYRRTEDGGWFLPEFVDETLLTATMTVGQYDPPGMAAGYSSAENPLTAGGITTNTFSDGSTTYRVRHILWIAGTQLLVTVNPSPPTGVYDNWRLLFGGKKYLFSEVTPTDAPEGGSSFSWYEPNQPWSISDTVSLELVKRQILDWEALRDETDLDTGTSFTDSEDKGDKQYVYRVWAYNDWGRSRYSWRGDWAFNGGDPGGEPKPAEYIPPPTGAAAGRRDAVQRSGHGRAGHRRLAAGGGDPDGGHLGHWGRRRYDQPGLHLPVGRRGIGYPGRDGRQLHHCRGRRGADHPGLGELHRR